MATRNAGAAIRTPPQRAALIFGVVYALVGVAGWFVTNDFTGLDDDAHLLGFHLNGAHNVVRLALGAVWPGACTRVDWARVVSTVFGAVLIVVAWLDSPACSMSCSTSRTPPSPTTTCT